MYWSNINWQGEPLFQQRTPFLLLAWPGDQQAIRQDEWSARFTGTLRVADSADYEFRLEADDGARLILDELVVAEGMISGRQNDSEGAAHLAAGDHRIQVDYFQHGGSMALRLYWRRPGEAWSPIPPESLQPIEP